MLTNVFYLQDILWGIIIKTTINSTIMVSSINKFTGFLQHCLHWDQKLFVLNFFIKHEKWSWKHLVTDIHVENSSSLMVQKAYSKEWIHSCLKWKGNSLSICIFYCSHATFKELCYRYMFFFLFRSIIWGLISSLSKPPGCLISHTLHKKALQLLRHSGRWVVKCPRD